MRLSFLPALVLALLLPASLHAQTAPGASPAARIVARTGATVSPEARRYFGLVPDAPPGTAVDVAATPDGGLTLTLHRPSRADTAVVLAPERAADLALYVDRYEELYWDERDDSDVTREMGPALTRLRRDGIAVPATLKREVPLTYSVRLNDGARLRGRVLRADERVVVLWSGAGPYRWDRLDDVSVIPTEAIEQADVAGSAIVPLAAGVVAHAAAAASVVAPQKSSRGAALGLAIVAGGLNAFLHGTKARGADALRSLRRTAFFRNGEPPELQARIADTPTRPTWAEGALRPSLADRWRHNGPFVSVSVGSQEERTPQAQSTTVQDGTGVYAGTPRTLRPLRFGAAMPRYRGEVELHLPIPRVPLPVSVFGGASVSVSDDAPETIQRVPLTYEESLVDRSTRSLYGGLSVGGVRLGQRLSVGVGVRDERATLLGRLYASDSPLGPPAPSDSAIVRTYREPIRHKATLVRATYEIFLTRITSVFVLTEWTPSWAYTVDTKTKVWQAAPGGTLRGTRFAHDVRFFGGAYSAGLRLHL